MTKSWFGRRLFWKIYLTLLASLVAVAVLIGAFWSLVGENPHERWGAFRIQLSDQIVPERDSPPGAIDAAIDRLSDEMGADISVYDAQGALAASRGPPILLERERGRAYGRAAGDRAHRPSRRARRARAAAPALARPAAAPAVDGADRRRSASGSPPFRSPRG